MHRLARIFFILIIAVAPGIAFAQAYPSKALRLIVPFPAGGPADLFGRALAQGMSANRSEEHTSELQSPMRISDNRC